MITILYNPCASLRNDYFHSTYFSISISSCTKSSFKSSFLNLKPTLTFCKNRKLTITSTPARLCRKIPISLNDSRNCLFSTNKIGCIRSFHDWYTSRHSSWYRTCWRTFVSKVRCHCTIFNRCRLDQITFVFIYTRNKHFIKRCCAIHHHIQSHTLSGSSFR